jgi:hypothetical protein
MAVAFSAMAIVADKGGDAERIQPMRDLVPLVSDRQAAVATTGTDDDSNSVRLFLRGEINDQLRLVLLFRPHRAGSASWPKQFRLGIIGCKDRSREAEQGEPDATAIPSSRKSTFHCHLQTPTQKNIQIETIISPLARGKESGHSGGVRKLTGLIP